MNVDQIITEFTRNAALVSAGVHESTDLDAALEKAVALCQASPRCRNLMPGDPAGDSRKIIAAPNLEKKAFSRLESMCRKAGLRLIHRDLRRHPGGIEMGITPVNFGVAETATLVLDSNSEDTRLATMLCETHVALLDKTMIYETALDCADKIETLLNKRGSYTAFITGPSRTADIERVLALGVHGPLALHIILTRGGA